MKRILGKTNKYSIYFENTLVVLFLSMACILVFLEVILRYIFNTSITWSSEIAVICSIWAVFIGLPMTLRHGAHIRVDVAVNLLGGNKKFVIVLLSTFIGLTFAVILLFNSVEYAAFLKVSEEKSATTSIPEYIYFLALPIGGLLLTIRYIQEALRIINDRKKGEKS